MFGKGNFPLPIPAVTELPFVLVSPLLGDVVGGMGSTRGKVHEEGLIGQESFLLTNPANRFLRQIFRQVVALFGSSGGFDGGGAFVQGRIPLVIFAANEAIEIFKAAAPRWPRIKWPHRAGLPDGYFMAFAKLSRRIAIQLQRQS